MLKLIKIPVLIKYLFPSLLYNNKNDSKTIYLTFDDGPCKILSPIILDELKKYKAKATFFYLGCQVEKHPQLVERCLKENHQIGNHTYSHLNGWKTKNNEYFQDIEKANKVIKSNLFRPPHGRIKPSQINYLKKKYKIIMWDVLSWDFEKETSADKCYNNIINNTKSGSIIVLHENEKSVKTVKQVLPRVLSYFSSKGFKFEKL